MARGFPNGSEPWLCNQFLNGYLNAPETHVVVGINCGRKSSTVYYHARKHFLNLILGDFGIAFHKTVQSFPNSTGVYMRHKKLEAGVLRTTKYWRNSGSGTEWKGALSSWDPSEDYYHMRDHYCF